VTPGEWLRKRDYSLVANKTTKSPGQSRYFSIQGRRGGVKAVELQEGGGLLSSRPTESKTIIKEMCGKEEDL